MKEHNFLLQDTLRFDHGQWEIIWQQKALQDVLRVGDQILFLCTYTLAAPPTYQTTSYSAIGETSYFLAFIAEAVVPTEISLCNYINAHFLLEENDGGLRT